MTTTRVLGIDPGTTATGWGVVEENGPTLHHVAHGTIRSASDAPMPERLAEIFRALDQVILQHHPQEVTVEEVFMAKNAQSALKLGQARGVAIAAASRHGLPVHEYTAVEIKKSVVGFGKAEKPQVQEMVRMLLSLTKAPPQDAADALAGAICHLHNRRWQGKIPTP